MTNAELRFMECVPSALKQISEKLNAVGTKFVRINRDRFVNPAEVSSVCQRRENAYGGFVTVAMRGGDEWDTAFKTVEEAAAALSGNV